MPNSLRDARKHFISLPALVLSTPPSLHATNSTEIVLQNSNTASLYLLSTNIAIVTYPSHHHHRHHHQTKAINATALLEPDPCSAMKKINRTAKAASPVPFTGLLSFSKLTPRVPLQPLPLISLVSSVKLDSSYIERVRKCVYEKNPRHLFISSTHLSTRCAGRHCEAPEFTCVSMGCAGYWRQCFEKLTFDVPTLFSACCGE